jgi:hypothetical protein
MMRIEEVLVLFGTLKPGAAVPAPLPGR